MNSNDNGETPIETQAAQWLARRHSGRWNLQDNLALQAWLAQDASHLEAYDNVSRMWRDMDGVQDGLAAMRAAARQYRPAAAATKRRLVPAAGLVAGVLLAVTGAYWHWIGFEYHYQTGLGQTQTIALADGSSLRLNTDTALSVRVNANQRSVELQRGEAFFTVTHDPARPFTVSAGVNRIEDIGTRFNVYRQAQQVEVSVQEGSVQVVGSNDIQALLTAGQAAAFDENGERLSAAAIDLAEATAWLEGTLVFDDTPLLEVLNQLSRYYPIHFELANDRLNQIKISGRFQSGNLDALLKTLQASFPIKLTQVSDGHIRIDAR